MFYSQREFLLFLQTWEQTALISPYSTNWLVFIAEEYVYSAVRTESLKVVQNNFRL